jgi:uncharacterized membrane protein
VKYASAVTELDLNKSRRIARAIEWTDLREALTKGLDDFKAMPSHVFFLCQIYPLVAFFSARLTFQLGVFHLFFPLAAGIGLMVPFAALGFSEVSRRRELGLDVSWTDAVGALRSPYVFRIAPIGGALMAIFVGWLYAAQAIYEAIFRDHVPTSVGEFLHQVLATPSGWMLIVVGNAVGAVFAAVTLTVSVMSIPMILDHGAETTVAVRTSISIVLTNPKAMAVWGLLVAGALAIGCLPLFLGLAVVMPVLGHSTWHLYRKTVRPFGAPRQRRRSMRLQQPSRRWYW